MLTQATKYTIRSVLFLADKSSGKKKYGAKEIADELEIPLHFIAKLLQKLVKSGIISSLKGPGGGFYMTDENLLKNVCDIVNITQKEKFFDDCLLGLPKCGDENPCPVHHIMAPFKEALLSKFKSLTIAEFSEEIKKEGSYLSLKGLI